MFHSQKTHSFSANKTFIISDSNENSNPSGLASLFSPRMDFEQWKPLTGRGDPLRNDPTYDYEPPVLERVHYWADDSRLEREHYPEKKSEVLMLGVSSRKPSVTSRQPPLPTRRQQYRPLPPKYEDFSYKLSDTYPMTILVPPPPPLPGHQPSLYILNHDKMSLPNTLIKVTETPHFASKDTTPLEKLTSSYALQEANLIYQSSSTIQNWIRDVNQSLTPHINNLVSSDYAGWGPTTPLNEYDYANDTHNLISNDHVEISKQPYSFYRPMLSEAPPPPVDTRVPNLITTFLPTAAPATAQDEPTTVSLSQITWPTEPITFETTTEPQYYYDDITATEKLTTNLQPTQKPDKLTQKPKSETTLFDMLGPMMSMPIVNGPERLEDNLYAHATENMQVFEERNPEDILKLENMQTMQPPPPVNFAESSTISNKQPHNANSNIVDIALNSKPSLHTHDPYLHMRYTTPALPTSNDPSDKNKEPSEPSVPMYLIIQGHSKVKTYGSKPKPGQDKHTISNEIPKPNETNEVKHLHPIKEKFAKKLNLTEGSRTSKAKDLKALIDQGHGSIEIQEMDVGIKYDVSDGSEVPIELYRKGIVDSDENNYKSSKDIQQTKRVRRQIDLEDLLPFDEDTIEEYVFNYLESKKNVTGLTGLLAQVVTSDAAGAVDELEDDEIDGNQEHEDEDR